MHGRGMDADCSRATFNQFRARDPAPLLYLHTRPQVTTQPVAPLAAQPKAAAQQKAVAVQQRDASIRAELREFDGWWVRGCERFGGSWL